MALNKRALFVEREEVKKKSKGKDLVGEEGGGGGAVIEEGLHRGGIIYVRKKIGGEKN